MNDKELLKLTPGKLVDLGICPTCFIRKHNGALYGDNKDKLIYEEKVILTAFDKYGTDVDYQKGYLKIRFKNARGSLRSLEMQNHVPHGLHFQLNLWNPVHMSVKTIRRWTWKATAW